MTLTGDLQRLVAGGDRADTLEVGADGEDERLAGDAEADDLLGVRAAGGLVERVRELGETGRAEAVRLGVVEPVVERQEHESACTTGQLDVLATDVGDDLVRVLVLVLGHQATPSSELFEWSLETSLSTELAYSAWCGFSQMTAPPMPIPMHIAVRP